MLKRILRSLFSGLTQKRQRAFCIVAATRLTEAEFSQKSLLGRTLRNWPQCQTKIFFENSRGLSEIYNETIATARKNDILIFVHDDVWIEQADFFDQIRAGLKQFDILGIAGNTRRSAQQYAWLFRSARGSEFELDRDHLSGAVLSGNLRRPTKNIYGPTPAACELLDGVLLVARAGVLKGRGVQFDDRFLFDFYDLDFCRTCRSHGLKLGTWPLEIFHLSPGVFGSTKWRAAKEVYMNKWGD